MKAINRFRIFLYFFGRRHVPMIAYTRPKIIQLDDETLIIRIKLRRRTKNHLNSMYFGALAVGADLSGGLHAFYHAQTAGQKISLAFKHFQAEFIKRAEDDVFFVCKEGARVKAMLEESATRQIRLTQDITVDGYTHYFIPDKVQHVAKFVLGLSVKHI